MKRTVLPLAVTVCLLLCGCKSSGEGTGTMNTAVATPEVTTTSANTTAIETAATTALTTTPATAVTEPEPVYAQVSEENTFYNYKLVEDYRPTEISGTLGAKAVDFLADSEYYAETEEHLSEFIGKEDFADYFDEGGNIVPKLRAAYPNDYDGDGKTETFLLVDMPYPANIPAVRSFLIFADKDENMTILDYLSAMYPVQLLDYGQFRQITFGGYGTAGAERHATLYGVQDGQAVKLYNQRGSYYKTCCFLTATGWQGSGDFMYYDTVAREYRAIAGEKLDMDNVRKMDSTGALSAYYDAGYCDAQLLGGRYYVFSFDVMDPGTAYLYEDGAFVQTDECENVRLSWGDGVELVKDIDINKALAEMVTVE